MHGPIEHHGRDHTVEPECADEGCCLPMAMGHRRPTTLAAWRTAVAPCHLGRRTGFVDKDKTIWLQIGLSFEPVLPTHQDVRPLLFACVRGFF